jgi:hypothetical protein
VLPDLPSSIPSIYLSGADTQVDRSRLRGIANLRRMVMILPGIESPTIDLG